MPAKIQFYLKICILKWSKSNERFKSVITHFRCIHRKMRLTHNKIEQILVHILGEEGLPLVQELLGKENISEFDLASKIKEDIKRVRKMLYILYNHNLVEFNRKKDKRKGWYIYYWTLLPESIRFSYFKTKRDLLERLKLLLDKESKELFFGCQNKCVRLNFDQAMDFEFHCPECGELINQEDGKEKIAHIQKRITETAVELEILQAQRYARRKAVKERKKERKSRKRKTIRKKATLNKKIPKHKKKAKK